MTDDPDIQAKIHSVTNHVQFEMARFKRIHRYVEMDVQAGDTVKFEDIAQASGSEVYQLDRVCGVRYEEKAGGTVLKILESGRAEIEFFAYPERITEKTNGSYEFEFSEDALEILPYGVAAYTDSSPRIEYPVCMGYKRNGNYQRRRYDNHSKPRYF